MCLLVLKLENTALPLDHARSAAHSNDDGFGLAYHDGTQWQVHRTLDVLEHLRVLPEAFGRRALVHYRMATHGRVSVDNVHPFLVGEPDDPQSFVVAHNGMFSSMPRDAERSDTRLMVEHVFANLKPGWAEDPILLGQLNELFGYNKVAVLFTDGTYLLFGEKAGHWNTAEDIWYSNHSYSGYTTYRAPRVDPVVPAPAATTPPSQQLVLLPGATPTPLHTPTRAEERFENAMDPTVVFYAASLLQAQREMLDAETVAYLFTARLKTHYALCGACATQYGDDVWTLTPIKLSVLRNAYSMLFHECAVCHRTLRVAVSDYIRSRVRALKASTLAATHGDLRAPAYD
jgi:glutamine amidotransferase